MDSLATHTGQQLSWQTSPTAKRTYELRDGQQIFATLAQPSIWARERIVTTATGQWTLTLSAWSGMKITIKDQTGVEVGYVKRSAWMQTATLEWKGIEQCTWRGKWLRGKWAWVDANGGAILSFAPHGIFRPRCDVTMTFTPGGALDVDPALLAALGWYLIIIQNEQAAAISAATVHG